MLTELLLYFVYVMVGPVAWIVFAIGMASSRRRMDLVRTPGESVAAPAPRVTILIPAKDEGERIRDCLQSALAQDYPNFDVLTIDDRSTDQTGRFMDELAGDDTKLKVLHIRELPEGWTGKNHALHAGVQRTKAEWLLLVDSDVILQPDALSATLGVAQLKRFDMLSLILRQETRTAWEEMLVPLASMTFGAAYLMGMNNSPTNKFFFGNGQFMLIRRSAYEQIGGHEAVKSQYNEDMALARLFKQSGLRARIAWGTELGAVRMYDSLGKIMNGWSRIFFGSSSGSPWRSLGAIAFILIGCYTLFPAAVWGIYRMLHPIGFRNGVGWIIAAGAHWVLMTVQIGIIYRWMRNRAVFAALFPVTGWFLLVMLFRAVWMCISGKVIWRGTSYSHRIAPIAPRKTQ